MQADNPADEPQVTITRRGEDKVEEFRIRGKLYMVRVTPPMGCPIIWWTSAATARWPASTPSTRRCRSRCG